MYADFHMDPQAYYPMLKFVTQTPTLRGPKQFCDTKKSRLKAVFTWFVVIQCTFSPIIGLICLKWEQHIEIRRCCFLDL